MLIENICIVCLLLRYTYSCNQIFYVDRDVSMDEQIITSGTEVALWCASNKLKAKVWPCFYGNLENEKQYWMPFL